MEKIVILGGGIAGLSCLNALLDRGETALLLEGSAVGTPKICGEFIAPLAVKQLEQWKIGSIVPVNQVNFFTHNKPYKIELPQTAGAFSRQEAELQLAKRATSLGGRVREYAAIAKIIPATPKTPHIIHLASGQIIKSKNIVIATGKITSGNVNVFVPKYAAFKLNLPYVLDNETLHMFSLKHAYLGIVPISKDQSNCAGLIKKECMNNFDSAKQFLSFTLQKNKILNSMFKNINIDELNWFQSLAPEFQLKKMPNWPNSYCIGDAMVGLHPAIGYGFAHSITSAVLAADMLCSNQFYEYQSAARKLIRSKVILGKLMHKILINPKLSAMTFPILHSNPWLYKKVLNKVYA